MDITFTIDGKEESLTVHNVRHDVQEYDDDGPYGPGTEFWVIEGIQPHETGLIPSEYIWLSGSLGYPMSDEESKKFPLVYVPKGEDATVEIDDE